MRDGRSPRQTLRAVIALALAYLMAWGGVPAPALAEMAEEAMAEEVPAAAAESQEQGLGTDDGASAEELRAQGSQPAAPDDQLPATVTVEGGPIAVPADDGQSNDELLDAYVQHKLDEPLAQADGGIQLGVQSARDGLTAAQKKAYDKLKQLASNVAAGSVADTTIAIPAADLMEDYGPWSASDLGVKVLTRNRQLTEETKNVTNIKVKEDLSAVIHAVLADCPYEFYWFDRQAGYGFPFHMSGSSQSISVTQVILKMYVSADYSKGGRQGTTKVDTSKTTHVNTAVGTAVNEAKRIVSAAAGLSNLDRLKAYKNAICTAVTYNANATQGSTVRYGNPWQLIWVFDKNTSTNVVCEGYSKAFKYLCDLTWTGENPAVKCLLASGTMHGGTGAGNHMWNVVHMDDGRNYLVDVTNCDESSAAAPDKLFMAYGPSGSYDTTYTFSLGGTLTIGYQYDKETMRHFSASDLTISAQRYQSSAAKPGSKHTNTFPDVPEGSWFYGVVYRAAGLGLINGYEDGRFGPNDNVTRGQVAVILWNMAGKPSPKGTPKTFPDVAAGKYYYDAVRWASSVGVVNGYGSGKFGP